MTTTGWAPDGDRRAAELTGLELRAELGRGAFTSVHEAVRGGLPYALKRPVGDTADPALLAAFQREAALLACIDDPGVPRIHAAGTFQGVPALVLEYIPGGSLADLLSRGPLGPERVVELAAQLARGLAAAHRAGLVHRDVKPGNIMISPGRPAKLIDFGLARLGDGRADEDDDSAVGTFLYAAPEQSGVLKRPVDGRADLYSLGVVLFECLTGRVPFEAGDVGELLTMHLTAPVPDLVALHPGVPPQLVAVIGRLLAKDPDDRYPDAAELLADLRSCPGGAAAEQPAVVRWPLAGRDGERELLAARWQRARAGHGGVARIRGAAGSGRSRLADEAEVIADGRPVLRATGQADGALPLAALRTALDHHLQVLSRLPDEARAAAEQDVREAALAAGPSLLTVLSARLTGLLGDAATVGGEGTDDQVFTAAALFLGELAMRADGMALILDDAQWLDAGSSQVLTRLAVDLPRLPLLVVLAETDDAGLPVGVPADIDVVCEPLDPKAVDELIASRLPGASVPAELAGYVAARTGGSPLAVVTYLLRLLDAGLLTPLWGTWRFDQAGADALPAADDVRALLAARLATLSPGERDVLVTAAVAGARFRTEMLGGSPDQVVATIAAGLERRVLEARAGGWYVFMHPILRESLLDGVGEDRLHRLHAAVAEALESLPGPLRDADHVYALARHHQRAGSQVAAGQRRASALAAGLRALDDRAPAEAIVYLQNAAADDPAPPTAVLHSLATAYLKAGRFADAGATVQRALAAEPDRRVRARLLLTEIEVHHTVWQDDRALDATARALTELRRPLPRNGFALIVTALAVAFAGGVVRRTRWGFGSVGGRRRDDLASLAAVLDAGGYAAGIGLRLREAGVLAMRAMYAVNRLGPSPEYVRIYALAGYVAAVIKLRRTAERCLGRATRVAADLGDPALVAYSEWLSGCARLFGGYDDGAAWLDTITRHARWFGPAQLIPGYATLGLRNLLRGYVDAAQSEYDRGLRRLPDVDGAKGTSFGMLSVMIPAIAGRPGDAAAALAELRAAFPDGGTTVQRANVIVAAACAAIEQGEFGEPFEQIVAEFRALGLRDRELMTQHKWFYAFQSHARMAQLRMAGDEQRPARLAAAKAAVADLRKVRRSSPLLNAAYLIGEAALAQLQGDNEQAIGWSDKAEKVARTADAPLVHFEVARFRARSFRQLGLLHEADRQARIALGLAVEHGWESRRRQARTEFGADEGAATGRRTAVGRPDAGRNRRLEALQQVGAAAATVLDPGRLVRVALDEVLRILGAERALFFLLDGDGEPLQFAGRSATGEELAETTSYGATLVRRVAESGEALVLTGTEQGAALGSRSAVVHGLRSILVVPVQFKGTTLGVVYLDSRLARGIFTDDDVEVLTAVTSHIAVSLETARAAQLHLAVRTAQQQQAFAEMLRASLAELSGLHDPALLLRRLFATLHGQVGAAAGVLTGPDGRLVLEVAGAAGAEVVGRELDHSAPPDSADPLLLDAAPAGPLAGFAAVLAVPLRHRDGAAGWALFGGAAFDDSARQVASALAVQGMTAYDNARLFSRVQELATTDELTGQHNRRHFYTIATALVDAAARGRRDLAAVMLDIDKFKGINDTYGHGVGDEVIRAVAARIRAGIRTSDVLGRYGGEEFAVVLPDHEGGAPELAERMRRAVADEPVPTAAGPVPVTISVGLARLEAADATLDQLLARADHALYRAKETGRNRVVAV